MTPHTTPDTQQATIVTVSDHTYATPFYPGSTVTSAAGSTVDYSTATYVAQHITNAMRLREWLRHHPGEPPMNRKTRRKHRALTRSRK
jgi:hypothetical protein